MEIANDTLGFGLVSRAVAFAMALVTTAFVATATAVIFTSGSHFLGA